MYRYVHVYCLCFKISDVIKMAEEIWLFIKHPLLKKVLGRGWLLMRGADPFWNAIYVALFTEADNNGRYSAMILLKEQTLSTQKFHIFGPEFERYKVRAN